MSCLWSDQSQFIALVLVFNLWFRFYFQDLYLIFNFSVAFVLLLPLDQSCSQVHIITSYCVCGAL